MAKEASVRKHKPWSNPMSRPEFDTVRYEQVLYLTTMGRRSGKPRTIEIWFVRYKGRLYLLAEHGLKAQWVRHIQAHPEVRIRIAQYRFRACGRLLDDARDRHEWQIIIALSRRKYSWGEGLPVALDLCQEQGLEST
jgi:deazaflavin-dependent oxidoreductase (nitroreductase family)